MKADPRNVLAMLAGLAAALVVISAFRRWPSEAVEASGIPSTAGSLVRYLVAPLASGLVAGLVVVLVVGAPSLRLGVIVGSLVALAGLTDVVPFDPKLPGWWGVMMWALAVAAALLGAHIAGAMLRRRARLQ